MLNCSPCAVSFVPNPLMNWIASPRQPAIKSYGRPSITPNCNLMKPPRSKLRGITRKGIVCETPRFLTLFPLQGNLEASSEESPDSNRLSSCYRRGNYPHSTEPVPSPVMVQNSEAGASFKSLANITTPGRIPQLGE